MRYNYELVYKKNSMARTLMANLPGLARTIIIAPICRFMLILPWIAELPMARTIFHAPKPI